MDISPAIISAISAAVLVPFFMALMRRIKVLRHEPKSSRSFAELHREYGRWELLSVPLSILFVSAWTLLIWYALSYVYAQQLAQLEPSRFIVALPDLLWVIPALFFAIFLAALPFHFLYLALLGRRRYAEYTEYSNQKFRLDTWKLFRYLGNCLLPVCLLLTLLALDSYARITDDEFVVNDFAGLGEKSYSLQQVRQLELVGSLSAPDGEIVEPAYYVIRFSGDEDYSFRNSPSETPLARQRRIVEHVAALTGLEIVRRDPPR